MTLRNLFFYIAFAFILVATQSIPNLTGAQERIAAIINDDVVSRRDLNERLKLALLTSNQPNTPETRRRLAPQVLRGVIDETLQVQEANRLRLQANDDELDASINDIASRNSMTRQQLNQFLASNNIDPMILRNQVRAQISWLKLIRGEISPSVNVTDDQVSLIVDLKNAESGEPQLLLSEILLPVYTPDEEQEVRQNAVDIIESLRDDADFAALSQQVSVGRTADDGGDLGWVSLSSMTSNFQSELGALPVGAISAPLRSAAGIHIFQVRERRSAAESAGTNNKISIAQIFYPVSDFSDQAALDLTRADAQILSSSLENCEDIEQAAGDGAADGSGMLGWVELDDLPPSLRTTVNTLEMRTISEPVVGPAGVHLLMICDRRDTVGVDSATRNAIREQLETEQIERLANRYLRDLRLDAYIDIRL